MRRWCDRRKTDCSTLMSIPDNVIDICPVGALLSRSFFYKSRVWYLKPTLSVCSRCAQWLQHTDLARKREWKRMRLIRRTSRSDR